MGPTRKPVNREANASAPTHVVADLDAAHVLCGAKRKDVLPLVMAPFVEMHVQGWGMVVCPGCAAAMVGQTYDPPTSTPAPGQAALW